MTLRKTLKKPAVQLQMGLAFLVVASLTKWFLKPGAVLSVGWTDGIIGLMYGISIGLMLLGIWRNSRQG
jgi:CHASE2 domain-containing sensor protein